MVHVQKRLHACNQKKCVWHQVSKWPTCTSDQPPQVVKCVFTSASSKFHSQNLILTFCAVMDCLSSLKDSVHTVVLISWCHQRSLCQNAAVICVHNLGNVSVSYYNESLWSKTNYVFWIIHFICKFIFTVLHHKLLLLPHCALNQPLRSKVHPIDDFPPLSDWPSDKTRVCTIERFCVWNNRFFRGHNNM